MAQNVFTKDLSQLTRDRELSILKRALGSGIYEGLVAKNGSNPWTVDFFQGWGAIQGALFLLDQDIQDIFDLNGGFGSDKHFQFWIAFWPGDDANDPIPQAITDIENNTSYQTHKSYTSGEVHIDYFESDYSGPADTVDTVDVFETYSQKAAEHILVCTDLYVSSSATDLSDARFVPAPVKRLDDLWEYDQTKPQISHQAITLSETSTDSTLRVRWRDMRAHAASSHREVTRRESGSMTELKLKGASTSGSETNPHNYTDKLEIDITADTDLVFLYARTQDGQGRDNYFRENSNSEDVRYIALDTSNMTGDTITDQIYENLQGDVESYNDVDHWPNRPELNGIIPIGVIRNYLGALVDTWVGFFESGEVVQAAQHHFSGINSTYCVSISSSDYSTTAIPDNTGDIDLVDLIPNIGTLRDLGLQDAYHSAATPLDGSGRFLDINKGAVDLDHYPGTSITDPNDRWMSPLRVRLDAPGSDIFDNFEAAIDVESPETDWAGQAIQHRKPLNPSTINSGDLWGGPIVDQPCRVEYDSNEGYVAILPETPNGNSLTSSKFKGDLNTASIYHTKGSRFRVTIESSGGGGSEKTHYQLVVPDDTNTHDKLWLRRANGDEDAIKNDFSNLSSGSPITKGDANCTIWQPLSRVGSYAGFNSLEMWGISNFRDSIYIDSGVSVYGGGVSIDNEGGTLDFIGGGKVQFDTTVEIINGKDLHFTGSSKIDGGGEFVGSTWTYKSIVDIHDLFVIDGSEGGQITFQDTPNVVGGAEFLGNYIFSNGKVRFKNNIIANNDNVNIKMAPPAGQQNSSGASIKWEDYNGNIWNQQIKEDGSGTSWLEVESQGATTRLEIDVIKANKIINNKFAITNTGGSHLITKTFRFGEIYESISAIGEVATDVNYKRRTKMFVPSSSNTGQTEWASVWVDVPSLSEITNFQFDYDMPDAGFDYEVFLLKRGGKDKKLIVSESVKNETSSYNTRSPGVNNSTNDYTIAVFAIRLDDSYGNQSGQVGFTLKDAYLEMKVNDSLAA